MASESDNPYFSELFNSFDSYVRNDYTLSGSTLQTSDGITNDKLSKFTSNLGGNSAFINIAGNYKYSCIVPMDKNQPPNYVGVLKENNALSGSFIDELLSFTESEGKDRRHINCTRAAEHLYDKAYRTYGTGKTDTLHTYCINFTEGMPYSIHEPALRIVHKDVIKQLNSIIDYAIATGQTDLTAKYDDVLVSNFLNLFFTADKKPRYYSLRTGILPSAIAYARFLQSNDSTSFMDHYSDFETEIDFLGKGKHFIPIGQGEQFLNSEAKGDRLYWYPFSTQSPYSYKFVTSGETTEDLRYAVDYGFNHYQITGDEAIATSLMTMIDSTSIQTDAIDAALAGKYRTILSYRSCLSDIPAPNVITVTDSYKTSVVSKINGNNQKCISGNRTDVIKRIDKWANMDDKNNIAMHPLLNLSGRKKGYLNVQAEQRGNNVSEDIVFSPAINLEELYYYNNGFTINPETRAVEHMNFYSTNSKDNAVDPYDLEFGVVSRDLYTVMNESNELKINKEQTIKDDAFGVLGKLPGENEPAWKTVSCGITRVINDISELTKGAPNHMFSVKGLSVNNPVPEISMNITTLHYGDGHGGEGDKDHGCNFYADDEFGGGYDCHKVYYLDTGEDYHERNYNKGMPKKEFDENKTVTVKFSDSDAVLGVYDAGAVYNMSNMTMNADSLQGYYYTVHILADDGGITADVKINKDNGILEFGSADGDGLTKDNRIKRYGTGLQYFFGGNCDKSIFDSYYNQGLTLYQLFDPTTDAYANENGKKYGRVINGLKFANRAFEWDYNIVLKAWNLALWIMRGYPNQNDRLNYSGTDKTVLYKTKDAAIALAAFFDYIYKTNDVKLVLGPSLKQINNAVGPYGSNSTNDGTTPNPKNLIEKYGKKGVASNKEYDNTTLRGASWDVIRNNSTSNAIYNDLRDHARVAAAVFVNRDSKLYVGSETEIGKNGVGRHYWSKGYTSGTGYNDKSIRSQWGEHWADARRSARHSDGYLHLDHYSWAWHIENSINDATEQFAPTVHENNRWHGAFMIHARKLNKDKGYNSPFNWHLGPFHEVSPEAKEHTNEYGVRNKLVYWSQTMPDKSSRAQPWNGPDADGGCNDGAPDTTWKQGWDGINGDHTWDHQNPNIRIRLPFLWRYLKSLREKGIYTDGQLMPCGIELHYCNYRKSLMSSVTNVEHTVPISTGIITPSDGQVLTDAQKKSNEAVSRLNKSNWQSAIKSPSSVTFAETLYDTYAITRNTITEWYNMLNKPEFYTPLIRNILAGVRKHSDKLTAMYRTKRYVDDIAQHIDLKNGKTLYNLPILPSISMFGASDDVNGSIDESVVMTSNMKLTYNVLPNFNLDTAKTTNVAIGITYPPALPDGQSANQFTAISSGLYADLSNFDGDTIGWIVPIPTKANLALLNAYNGAWRHNMSSVIPLKTSNLYSLLEKLNDSKLHWIGWVNSDSMACLNSSDLDKYVHICRDNNALSSLIGGDVVVIPTVSLKIIPYFNKSTECTTDGVKCMQSDKLSETCKDIKPFSVKVELDTRGTDNSLKMIMIRDKIKDDVEYNILNISNNVSVKGKDITTYMTTVTYNKDKVEFPAMLQPL